MRVPLRLDFAMRRVLHLSEMDARILFRTLVSVSDGLTGRMRFVWWGSGGYSRLSRGPGGGQLLRMRKIPLLHDDRTCRGGSPGFGCAGRQLLRLSGCGMRARRVRRRVLMALCDTWSYEHQNSKKPNWITHLDASKAMQSPHPHSFSDASISPCVRENRECSQKLIQPH